MTSRGRARGILYIYSVYIRYIRYSRSIVGEGRGRGPEKGGHGEVEEASEDLQ
jgi:hypothetical protein